MTFLRFQIKYAIKYEHVYLDFENGKKQRNCYGKKKPARFCFVFSEGKKTTRLLLRSTYKQKSITKTHTG